MSKTIKKLIAKSLMLIMCTSLVSTTAAVLGVANIVYASAATVTAESDFEFDSKTGTITGYNGSDTEVVIPSKIDGVSVTSIGEYAFEYCSDLTSISIPNSVKSIGEGSFYDCSKLADITIPNGVTSIGKWAFCGCSNLTQVTVSNTVTSIGGAVFSGCSSLKSITIPNSVKSIDDWAFAGCTSLKSITIPSSVTGIGMKTFAGCTSLASITIPNSVTSIGDNAFGDLIHPSGSSSSCKSAKFYIGSRSVGQLLINSGVDKDKIILDGDSSLGNELDFEFDSKTGTITGYNGSDTEVAIPSTIDGVSVKTIGKGAFEDCNTLTSVIIPNSVKSIDDWVFAGCTSLKSIAIPSSVTGIGMETFAGCTSLASITIPNSVTSIGDNAFGYLVSPGESLSSCNSAKFYIDSRSVGQLLINSGVDRGKIRW